jgi:hypothetical protein
MTPAGYFADSCLRQILCVKPEMVKRNLFVIPAMVKKNGNILR